MRTGRTSKGISRVPQWNIMECRGFYISESTVKLELSRSFNDQAASPSVQAARFHKRYEAKRMQLNPHRRAQVAQGIR